MAIEVLRGEYSDCIIAPPDKPEEEDEVGCYCDATVEEFNLYLDSALVTEGVARTAQ